MHLDHVAVAARDANAVLRQLCGDLGAIVIMGGVPPRSGFRAVQVRLGRGFAGMTVEILEPHETHHNDFLDRFVAGGDGPHHLTFKVPDIEAELERVRGLGIEPVGINFRFEYWKEMFVHPNDAHGPVIQIAQAGYPVIPMPEMLVLEDRSVVGFWQPWWEDPVVGDEAFNLERVVIQTADPAGAREFYGGLLEGTIDGNEVSWEGGTLLLEEADVSRPHVARGELSGPHAVDVVAAGLRFVSPT